MWKSTAYLFDLKTNWCVQSTESKSVTWIFTVHLNKASQIIWVVTEKHCRRHCVWWILSSQRVWRDNCCLQLLYGEIKKRLWTIRCKEHTTPTSGLKYLIHVHSWHKSKFRLMWRALYSDCQFCTCLYTKSLASERLSSLFSLAQHSCMQIHA